MNKTGFLNDHIFSLEVGNLPGLGNGKMGICIFYFQLYRITKERKYKKRAEELLDEVIDGINFHKSMDIKEGLLGIAIGMHHLHKEKFIRGDINEILGDIDDMIFKNVAFMENYSVNILPPEEAHFLLYYLCLRYKNQKNQVEKFIYSELIIKVIEFLYFNLTEKMLKEPISFNINYFLPTFLYTMGKVMSLNIYNYRIIKILEEFETIILGSFPVSHGNRLFLLCGLAELNRFYKKNAYSDRVNLLKSQIDIRVMLHSEFTNKQMFLHNGMSLIAILLLLLKEIFHDDCFDRELFLVYEKMTESDIWDIIGKETDYNYGLLGGIYTPVLVMNLIQSGK